MVKIYIIDFLKCMNPKLLAKNMMSDKKAANMAFVTIIVMVIAFVVLIWYIFYVKKLSAKGEVGVSQLKSALGVGHTE